MSEVNTLLLIGKPGSGKGTLGKRVSETLGWRYSNTGDLLREMTAEKSERAREIRTILATGSFAMTTLVHQLLDDELASLQTEQGIILDGYGRTLEQAKYVHKTLTRLGRAYVVVNLVIPDVVAMERMKTRSETEERTDSDTEVERIRRLRLYHEHTGPVLQYDEFRHRLVHMGTDCPKEESFERMMRILGHE